MSVDIMLRRSEAILPAGAHSGGTKPEHYGGFARAGVKIWEKEKG